MTDLRHLNKPAPPKLRGASLAVLGVFKKEVQMTVFFFFKTELDGEDHDMRDEIAPLRSGRLGIRSPRHHISIGA